MGAGPAFVAPSSCVQPKTMGIPLTKFPDLYKTDWRSGRNSPSTDGINVKSPAGGWLLIEYAIAISVNLSSGTPLRHARVSSSLSFPHPSSSATLRVCISVASDVIFYNIWSQRLVCLGSSSLEKQPRWAVELLHPEKANNSEICLQEQYQEGPTLPNPG